MNRLLFNLLGICLFNTIEALAQDTLFVSKHQVDDAVQNVFAANGEIYLKTTRNLWQLQDNRWEELPMQFNKPYVFYKNNSFYESNFIPKSEVFDVTSIKELIPQKGKFIATSARLGPRLFVATGSVLFEYEVRDHYKKTYHNRSVRDIFINDSLKVIPTYSGIFVNDTIKLSEPGFSNGPLSIIDNKYYLAWDELSQFFPPDSTKVIAGVTGQFSGKVRKIISWQGKTYLLNTRSVSQVSDDFQLTPIHQGLEYFDIEPSNDAILFSTGDGLCIQWNGLELDTLVKVQSRIRDIYIVENKIFLAADKGVFNFDTKNPNQLNVIFEHDNCVALQADDFSNLWIAAEDNLFVLPRNYREPIKVIPNVEFNREAILLHQGVLYAGAVDGLYSIDTYEFEKSYLPNLLGKLDTPFNNRFILWISVLALIIIIAVWTWRKYYRRKNFVLQGPQVRSELSITDIEAQVIVNKLFTVDALAIHMQTNSVQLNRIFKKFNTTPGRFLKEVKIRHARNLLNSGVVLEEVALRVGYSTKLLKKELKLTNDTASLNKKVL
jgi:AraC-like DNA-binding protein